MESAFEVKTDVFEGPLELLLRLIEKRKLFINDVSLMKVTDDYMAHVEQLKTFPTADVADFIVIASTLLLIKSRSLLPGIELTQEEQADIEELEERLKMYKRMVELSVHIRARFAKNIIFAKSEVKNIEPVFTPHEQITAENIFASIKDIMGRLPIKKILPSRVVEKVISLEEVISKLAERIQSSLKMSFNDFSKNVAGEKKNAKSKKEKKINIIMGFLAMLELVKQGLIAVRQEGSFGDIEMESKSVNTPNYN